MNFVKEERLGHVIIDDDLYQNLPDAVLTIMSQIAPIKVECLREEGKQLWKVLGYSPQFEIFNRDTEKDYPTYTANYIDGGVEIKKCQYK